MFLPLSTENAKEISKFIILSPCKVIKNMIPLPYTAHMCASYKDKYEVNAVNMAPKYYIVEAQALPEVFLKVAEAKRMLETGEAATVNEAARAVEISRSAFYKYRDSIAPFQNLMAGRIITFQLVLINKAGLLSAILSIFAASGANILTINQSIPTSGAAMVTISAETTDLVCSVEELLKEISAENGVVKAEIVAG